MLQLGYHIVCDVICLNLKHALDETRNNLYSAGVWRQADCVGTKILKIEKKMKRFGMALIYGVPQGSLLVSILQNIHYQVTNWTEIIHINVRRYHQSGRKHAEDDRLRDYLQEC